MKNLLSWFNTYVFIRWMVFIFIIGLTIWALIASGLSDILEELDIEIAESYLYGLLPPIYFFIIKYLLKQKYDYANLDKLSDKFKNAVLFIYSSIVITLAIFWTVMQVEVLAFFAGPFVMLTFAMLVYGCDSARNELKLLD